MSARRRLYFGLFLASGFCGLCYQVVWVRLAFSHFGVITPVLSVVVSVFMLGLALGSWAAGRWVDGWIRNSRFTAAHLYALAEAGIGLSAWVVPSLLLIGDRWLLPQGAMDSTAYLGLSAITLAATLLPWCFLMGTTFPLMMSFIRTYEKEASSSFSYLYLANVIGALAGTIITADVLIEGLGFRQTLAVAGLTNFGVALVGFMLGQRAKGFPKISDHSVRLKASASSLKAASQQWAYALLFGTGFIAMSLEVVWTRAFTAVLNTTIYAFALVLAVYLAATALGSYGYRRDRARHRVISRGSLLAALALSAFWTILITDPRLGLRTFGVEIGIFPLCLFLGYLTPQLIDELSGGQPAAAGRAYAVNVVGCILGPLIASYVLLPTLGVKNSLVLLSLPFVGMLLLESKRWKSSLQTPTWLLVLLSGGLAMGWAISHEEKYPGGVVRRDHTATVISTGEGLNKHLFVNGQGITVLTTITKTMSHFPLAYLDHAPRSALVICFGMGTTYRSLLSWDVDTTAVELVPSVRDAFGYYHADAEEALRNPKGRVIIDDGRRFLRRTDQRFDVITIDPPPPVEAAGSSLLYSTGMYALLRPRLAPGGILQQWFPGNEGPEAMAIARSLDESFPHVRVFRSMASEGLHFLASDQPLTDRTAKALARRLPEKARKDLVEWETQTPEWIFSQILSKELSLADVMGTDPQRIVTDDRPYNEYYFLRRNIAKARKMFAQP